MLTIKHRFNDQAPDSESSFVERPKRSTHVLTPEAKSSTYESEDTELIEKINKIKNDNDNIRRENLLFSRYLLRINSTNFIETFDEYEDENKILHEILNQMQSSESTRRYSLKKSSSHTKDGAPVWTKVSLSRFEHNTTRPSYISRIEQERLRIAAYEVEQTRLERERMMANAAVKLDKLEMLEQTTESDRIDQQMLNRELQKRVKKYRIDVGEEEFNSPYLRIPAELVVERINKRIHSRTTSIGLVRVDTIHLHTLLDEVNKKIRALDILIDQIDTALGNTRISDNAVTYEERDREYKIRKSSQYPLFRRLQEKKIFLKEQQKIINDMKHKCEILQHQFDRTLIEIYSIKQECQLILQENYFLKNRIENIIKVPTINDYAQIIEQTKDLQHGIDIWTKRVNIAETVLTQLERQNKPPKILPPLYPAAIE